MWIIFFFAELQKIRQKVVSEIKSTKQLEDDLDQMDIKIGLLIKNRVTLQVQNFFYLKLCILNNFRICIPGKYLYLGKYYSAMLD